MFSLLCGPTTDISISGTVCRWKDAYNVSVEADMPVSKFCINSDFLLLGLV